MLDTHVKSNGKDSTPPPPKAPEPAGAKAAPNPEAPADSKPRKRGRRAAATQAPPAVFVRLEQGAPGQPSSISEIYGSENQAKVAAAVGNFPYFRVEAFRVSPDLAGKDPIIRSRPDPDALAALISKSRSAT